MPTERRSGSEARMRARLRELLADREALEEELGTSSVYDITSMMCVLREERDALREHVQQLEAEQRAVAPPDDAAADDEPHCATPEIAPQDTEAPVHATSDEAASDEAASDEAASDKAASDEGVGEGSSEEEASDEAVSDGEASTRSIAQALLGDVQLEQQWRDVVADWREDAPSEARAAVAWVRDLRDELLDSVDTIDDPLELEEALAMQHIQFKSTWIMLNTKLQYQMMRHGTPNFTDFHRASLVTSLIAKLEEIMPGEEVQQIESFLSDPVNRQKRR